MTKLFWNLITLDATKILCNLTERNIFQENGNYKIRFKYDLSGKNPLDRDIIFSEDTFADNALFFQLRKIMPENSMREYLVFIDFKEIFSKNNFSLSDLKDTTPAKSELLTEKGLIFRLKFLFEDGIFLSFDGENFNKFVPFDKSNSMARNCQITFIDSKIKAVTDKRLMLDMNFWGKKLELSKFYSYRGLYLSEAFRIDANKNFPLNEETVIILEDYTAVLTQNTFTAEKRSNQNFWDCVTKEKNLTLKLFDGEGLIAPDFAEYISDKLQKLYDFPADSHSFQIRMPFTKGVLHEVNFNKFFADCLDAEFEELPIKDIFGITRDLRKAKIILNKSMFKCANWIKDFSAPDPMKYFFEKFAEYEHALYIVTTEARFFNPGSVKLNYQFLSTLALSNADFDSLVDEQRQKINSFNERFAETFTAPSAFQDFADNFDAENKFIRPSNRQTCLKAVAKNSAFLRDPKVKNIYDSILKNYECDLGLGRPEVEGEVRFLSCDLLALLIKILEHAENVTVKNSLKKQCLDKDKFFMAENKISISANEYYAFLRNPHLSRNEQVILRAYEKRGTLYEKYFSHLKGAVMVSAASNVAMILGGADFDGDLVKIIKDSRIVQAVQRGNPNAILPPIEIPAAAPKSRPLSHIIPLAVVIDTFSNKVGLISDLAIKLSEKEYYGANDTDEYKNICAKCTIFVGLEIDAAKTGIHPDENINELQKLAAGCGKNIFLESKKVIEQILKLPCSPKVVCKEDTFILYLSADAIKRGLAKLIVPFEKNELALLERLPARYLQFVFENQNSAATDSSAISSRYFNFEISGWRKNLDENRRLQLKMLVKAYLHILSLDAKTRYIKNKISQTKFNGHILNILALQYDDLYQKLSCGTEIVDALNQLYAELSFQLKNNDSVTKALNSLKKYNWQLTPETKRPKVAAKILGINENVPAVFELLFNFRCNGFMLFYYVLKELQSRLFEETDALEPADSADDTTNFQKNLYYDELHKIYSAAVAEKKSKQIWNAELIKICRRNLSKIFDGDFKEALKYFWSIRSSDSGHNFFWNIFAEQEILSEVYEG